MLKRMMKRCTFNNIVFTIISSLSCSYEHIVKHSLWYPTHRFMGWLRGAPPPKYGRSLMFGVGLLRNEVSGTRGSRKPCVSGTPGFPDTKSLRKHGFRNEVSGTRGSRKPCVSSTPGSPDTKSLRKHGFQDGIWGFRKPYNTGSPGSINTKSRRKHVFTEPEVPLILLSPQPKFSF